MDFKSTAGVDDKAYETYFTAADADSGSSRIQDETGLGRDEFLKLLVAQLQHQDPLEPLDASSFVAELAQFASLEALHRVDEGIADLNAAMGDFNTGLAGLQTSLHSLSDDQTHLRALSFLGRYVQLASGSTGLVERVSWGKEGLRLGLDGDRWAKLADVVQVHGAEPPPAESELDAEGDADLPPLDDADAADGDDSTVPPGGGASWFRPRHG